MNLTKYISRCRTGVHRKGTHRDKNYTLTGKEAPTAHQAATEKWKQKRG